MHLLVTGCLSGQTRCWGQPSLLPGDSSAVDGYHVPPPPPVCQAEEVQLSQPGLVGPDLQSADHTHPRLCAGISRGSPYQVIFLPTVPHINNVCRSSLHGQVALSSSPTTMIYSLATLLSPTHSPSCWLSIMPSLHWSRYSSHSSLSTLASTSTPSDRDRASSRLLFQFPESPPRPDLLPLVTKKITLLLPFASYTKVLQSAMEIKLRHRGLPGWRGRASYFIELHMSPPLPHKSYSSQLPRRPGP